MTSGFHATSAAAKSADSASYHSRVSRYTSHSVTRPMRGATRYTAPVPPTSVKSAITSDVPIGNVGAMPAPPGAGVQPSGDAIARRFAADIHSAIGAGSISLPPAIVALALT